MNEHVGFGEAELVVHDLQELSLNPGDVPCAEESATDGPVFVLDRDVIDVLDSQKSEPFNSDED